MTKPEKMRKNLFIGAFALISCSPLYAGDYLTNTNQHAAFLRMAARGASIDIDGAYSNPAGLAFLQKDGSSFPSPDRVLTRPVRFMPLLLCGRWTVRTRPNISRVRRRHRSSLPSTVRIKKTSGWFLRLLPLPAVAVRHRSATVFPCSMPWLQD